MYGGQFPPNSPTKEDTMRQVAILGVAMTKFGVSEKTNLEMFAEAGIEAIAQSNLEPKDMEALFCI